MITEETITFLRKPDIKEIRGYHAARRLAASKPGVPATCKTNGGLR